MRRFLRALDIHSTYCRIVPIQERAHDVTIVPILERAHDVTRNTSKDIHTLQSTLVHALTRVNQYTAKSGSL